MTTMASDLLETLIRAFAFFGVAAAVFWPLERVLARRARLGRPQVRTDVAFYLFNPLIVHPLAGLSLLLFAGAISPEGHLSENAATFAGWPLWLQALVVFSLGEFLGYVFHRALHQVPVLWRFHRVHHSAENFDWLCAHRQHPLETWGFI